MSHKLAPLAPGCAAARLMSTTGAWPARLPHKSAAGTAPGRAPRGAGPRQVHSFGELLALRVGFAAAQATQNPICFSLIPELSPRGRNTAMAAYNAAIYCGRALSFAAVIIAGRASRCDMTRCRLRGLATCL